MKKMLKTSSVNLFQLFDNLTIIFPNNSPLDYLFSSLFPISMASLQNVNVG